MTRRAGDKPVFDVTVPPGSPFFEGHFPGFPVLPGVAQLRIVLDALALVRGAPPQLLAIRRLRFRRTVAPGDRLVLSLGAGAPVTFRFTRDDACVSDGHLDVA